MNNIKNIIQFTPYFSPHIGGVEKVVEDISGKWTYGKSFIVSGNLCQQSDVYNRKKENERVFFLPGFDIVDNLFLPAFWTKIFWKQLSEIKIVIKDSPENFYIITHTRFFLTSFFGGLFAKKMKLKWIHIEHGSDYVKLSSPIKTKIAYIYDRLFGKWILKNADMVLCISEASKSFVEREFMLKSVLVWYRGIDFSGEYLQKREIPLELVFIGRLVTLKGVNILIESYKKMNGNIRLTIIGNGEQRSKLEEQSKGYNIDFLGMRDAEFIFDFLSGRNCILINPSYQEGLPTTVIEGLLTRNIVIATDVGGTKEISQEEDLILFSPGDIGELHEKILYAKKQYFELQGKSYESVKQKFSREKSRENLYNFLD